MRLAHPRMSGPRTGREGRRVLPVVLRLEHRVVPSLYFPGIAGVAFDSSGDLFVSYDSSSISSGRQQSVAEVSSSGRLLSSAVFGTTGARAFPGALNTIGASATLPAPSASGDLMEIQPDGELYVFNSSGASSQFDNLAVYRPNASSVYDVQTGTSVDLTSTIDLAGATFGDFGIHGDSLVISAESNNWDFVLRVTYGPSGGVASVLAASPASDGLSTSPEGLAVDSQGRVLTTLPYVPAGSSSAIHVPVGFNLDYDSGSAPAPFLPTLGKTTVPDLDAGAIAVDSQDNFIVAATDSSLYGGGPGIVHIDPAQTAFLADPVGSGASPGAITYQNVGGSDYLAFTDSSSGTYTIGHEIPLFSGQVTPDQLRHAYGIDQILFTEAGGTTVSGDGSGQTIAIVEEGVDPTIGADLTTFDQYFNIPAPPSFQVIDQNGVATQNLDIIGEASLDVEWAHAMAPGASIVVYNAAYSPGDPTGSFENLITAMQQASKLPGVSVVTLSYGMPEPSVAASGLNQHSLDANFTTSGVTFLAASGDSGIYGNGGYQVAANYPAASPNIVSVGGTSITIDPAGDYPGTGSSGEVAWGYGSQSGTSGGGGGGLSSVEAEPAWQAGVVPSSVDSTGARAIPDVAIDSGNVQQYDVFTSTLAASSVSSSAVGWLGDAGTSAAAPIWAGLIAIANQGRILAGGTPLTGNTQTLPALYSLPSTDFHDIVHGNNGYPAGPGYDLTSGRGTPVANLLVPDLAGYQMSGRMTIGAEPPGSVVVGSTFSLGVQVVDGVGNPVNGGTVTVALANNPGDAILGGTLTEPIVSGVATFSDLSLSQPGTGYTLTVTATGVVGSETTTPVTVTSGSISTTAAATASPSTPVYGQPVTLTATVSVGSPASGVPTGSVTFKEGSAVLGMATLHGGVAQLTTTPTAAGTQTFTILYGGDANDQPSNFTLSLAVGKGTAALEFGNLSLTFTGSALAAPVVTTPAGLSGVVITYSHNGAPVSAPTIAGTYDVTASLDNPNYTAQAATGTLVIGQATPTLTWLGPAAITTGTPLTSAQLDATASFNGVTLPGVYSYSPSAGTVLPSGNGQILGVSFAPADAIDYRSVSLSVPINVLSPPPRVLIVAEQHVFRRPTRKGKSFGKPVLTGFTLTFNLSIDASAASNPNNYQLDTVTVKRVQKTPTRVLQPIRNFTVSYSPASDTVTLSLTRTQTFPTGGQLRVLPGVLGSTRASYNGTVLSISSGGKKIGP
jgi:hypothetical protein